MLRAIIGDSVEDFSEGDFEESVGLYVKKVFDLVRDKNWAVMQLVDSSAMFYMVEEG